MHRFNVTGPVFQVAHQVTAITTPQPQAPSTPQPSASAQGGHFHSPAASRARFLHAQQRRDNSLFSDFRISCAIPRDLESRLRQTRSLVTARSIVSEMQKTGVAGPVIKNSVIRSIGLPEDLKYRFLEKMVDNRRVTLLFGYNENRRQIDVVKWADLDEQERLSINKQGARSRNAAVAERAGLEIHHEALAISTTIDNKTVDVLFIRNVNSGCVEKVMLPQEMISRVFSPVQRAMLAAHIRGLNTRRRLDNEIGKRPSIVDLVPLCAEKELSSLTSLIGVLEIGSDGSMKIRLMFDDMLNICLSTPESSPLVHRIIRGEVDRDERLELLRGILERYRPAAGSRPGDMLRQAIDDMIGNTDSYSDPAAFLELLYSAGTDLRSRALELACQEFRAVLVNTLHEYKPPLHSKVRHMIHQMVDAIEANSGHQIAGEEFQKAVQMISQDLAKLGAINGNHLEVASIATREAPRMPSDCLAHWLTVLEDAISDLEGQGSIHEAEEVRTMQMQAKDYWLAQDLRIEMTRKFFNEAAQRCVQGGWEDLAAFAQTLLSQLPPPGRDGFAENATRLHDNPYGRAYDVFLVHSAIKTPHTDMLNSVHELGCWLSTVLVPDPDNPTELDLKCIASVQANLRAKRWHWLPGLPSLTAFIDAPSPRDAAIALLNYLEAPKSSGLDCIAIPYVVSRGFLFFPRHLDWLNECNEHYDKTIKKRRTRLDNLNDAPDEYKKFAEQLYDEGWVDRDRYNDMLDEVDEFNDVGHERMVRTRHAGTTLLHHPAAVQEEWMSESIRPINHFKPDFSGLRERELSEERSVAEGEVTDRMARRFAQIARNGRFAGDESGVTHLVLFATSIAKRAGFRIDADAIWKATAMLTTYNGGHQLEECHTVAQELNGLLDLDIGEFAASEESNEFNFCSSFTRNGEAGEYWNERAEEAFSELFAYFKKISVYGDIRVAAPSTS